MPNIILVQNDYLDYTALSNAINYITRSTIIGGYALDPDHACFQMKLVKERFYKTEGVQLIHFIISYSTPEAMRADTDEILNLGFQIGQLFHEYQMIYAVHFDTLHMHLHVIMNTVSFISGLKYSQGLAGFGNLERMLQGAFPKSDIGIYRSFPQSEYNAYSFTYEDSFLRIG